MIATSLCSIERLIVSLAHCRQIGIFFRYSASIAETSLPDCPINCSANLNFSIAFGTSCRLNAACPSRTSNSPLTSFFRNDSSMGIWLKLALNSLIFSSSKISSTRATLFNESRARSACCSDCRANKMVLSAATSNV